MNFTSPRGLESAYEPRILLTVVDLLGMIFGPIFQQLRFTIMSYFTRILTICCHHVKLNRLQSKMFQHVNQSFLCTTAHNYSVLLSLKPEHLHFQCLLFVQLLYSLLVELIFLPSNISNNNILVICCIQ